MENNENTNKGGKAMSIFQKLYCYRLKIDRKGKTILNWSSLFSLLCLILAPHVSIIGIILSLVLGYHISLETEGQDEELEQRVRQAANTVKKTATVAARTIRDEVNKARSDQNAKRGQAEPVMSAPTDPVPQRTTEDVFHAAGTAPAAPDPATVPPTASAPVHSAPQMNVEGVNRDLVNDLEKHADAFQANPATYRTVYSATAGSVPTLEIHEEAASEEAQETKYRQQG